LGGDQPLDHLRLYLQYAATGTIEVKWILELRGPPRGIQGGEGLVDHTEVPVFKLLGLGQWSVGLLNASAHSKRDIHLIGGGNCESKILVSQLRDEATLVVAVRWRARVPDLDVRDWVVDLSRHVSQSCGRWGTLVNCWVNGRFAGEPTSLDQQQPVELLIMSAST
jgi:hypothetical protein